MENFRKRTKENPQAIDSILNAPTRSTHGPHKPTLGVEAFKRPNGFYANARTDTLARAIPGESTSPQQGGSILHMTLPGGALDGAKKKAKKDGAPKSKWRSIRKWTLRSGLVLGAFVILIGGYLAAKGYFKLHSVFKGGGNAPALQDNVSPELLKGEGDGRINILLLGRGGIGHDGPDLTDTILVASIDPVNKTAALVSLPRDFWVTTGSSSTKVNSVYANAKYKALNTNPKDKAKAEAAGIEAIKKKVSEVFDIPLHYYAMIDFKAFQQAIDTVGGVTIDVPEAVVDYSMAWENKGNPVLAKKGVQTFDGYHALMYVRSRHGSARGDFDRAERQRLLISAVGQKILSAGTYTNPVKISQLLDALGEHVSTDLSISDTLRLMKIAKGIPGTAIASVGLADPPHVLVTTGMISGQSVVRPLAGIGEFGDIQAYVPVSYTHLTLPTILRV